MSGIPYLSPKPGCATTLENDMEVGTFTFGKHRGLPACDVPMEYLLWAVESMATPPECVLEELRRRAAQYGSRWAVEAQAALNGLGYRGAKRARRKPARAPARARRKARAERNDAVFIGQEFRAGRAAWLEAGGDESEPPF